jgi:ubiquinone/menaquinone biosynthesis C-methylase UbiE
VNIIEYWNESGRNISENQTESSFAVEKEKLFPRNSKICDLGGGSGADSIYFISKGHEVTLVDAADVSLKRAEVSADKLKLSNKLTTVQADLSHTNLSLGKFDIVYSHLALHYFDQPTTVKLLMQAKNLLTPGGYFYAVVKSPADDKEFKFLLNVSKEISPGLFKDEGILKSRYTIKQWQEMLKEAGISSYEVNPYKEDLSKRGSKTRSGNLQMILNEIIFRK